jgi:hypothetical protein
MPPPLVPHLVRIAISLVAFVISTMRFHRNKIPMGEFLLYGPMLFATCLSVGLRKSKPKGEWNSMATAGNARFLEIERIRQVAIILSHVGFNARSFVVAIRFAHHHTGHAAAQQGFPAAAQQGFAICILGFGIQNAILMAISEPAVVFD